MSGFHLLHIVRNAEPDIGGIAGLAEKMTSALAIRQSMLFLSGPGPLSKPGIFGAIEPVVLPWRNSKDIAGNFGVLRLLRRMKPDLIHQHAGGWPIRLLARLAGVGPIILHLHGRDIEGIRNPRRLVQSTLFSDLVVAVSRAIAEDSRDPRCIVVPNGVDLPDDSERAPEPDLIVTAGRFVPIRGHDLLIEALADLKGLRLDLAGAGPERQALEALAQRLGLGKRVRFLGWLDDLAPLYGRGAIYVSPAREDGFGLALAEAMAMGLPVIATDVGGVADLVGDAGILVPPERPDALARAIAGLAQDRGRQMELGRRARARIADLFSVSRMRGGMLDAYRDCLHRRGRHLPGEYVHG